MSDYYEYTADKFVFKVKKDLQYSKDEVWVKNEAMRDKGWSHRLRPAEGK